MKVGYKQIEFGAGESIESAVKELKKHKNLVCGSFNGVMLYSDKDDINSAYKRITGKTKEQYDKALQKEHDKYEEHKRKHKEAIPQLTKKWILKGKKVLDEKYMELWTKIVPIRLGDLYEGMELGASLEIISALNSGCDMSVAKEIIEKQGHSGMSFGLVCSMVKSLCDRGIAFCLFINS